jgi:hypothetical protein
MSAESAERKAVREYWREEWRGGAPGGPRITATAVARI